jgi:toxin ParE1/3/4
MRRIIRKPRAKSDLLEIWRYLAERSPNAADRLLDSIEEAAFLLAEHPFAGRARPELGENLRSFPVKSLVIFYLPRQDGIDIIRVLSARRDLEDQDFSG